MKKKERVKSIMLTCFCQYNRPVARTESKPVKSVQPKYAVIDDFKVCRIDIDGTGKKKLPHGNVVIPVLRAQIPEDALIKSFSNDDKIKILTDFIPEQIQKIIEEGNFKAVNISAGLHKSIRSLKILTGINDLNPDNLSKYKEKIRAFLLGKDIDNIAKTIRSLENLIDKGIKVYLAGGNRGPEYVNLFSFARGVTSVGACDAKGKTLSSSADNSLLDRYARGQYTIICEKNSKNEDTYFIIDGSGLKVRLAKPFGEQMHPIRKQLKEPGSTTTIQGTSYAAPTALAKDIEKLGSGQLSTDAYK